MDDYDRENAAMRRFFEDDYYEIGAFIARELAHEAQELERLDTDCDLSTARRESVRRV